MKQKLPLTLAIAGGLAFTQATGSAHGGGGGHGGGGFSMHGGGGGFATHSGGGFSHAPSTAVHSFAPAPRAAMGARSFAPNNFRPAPSVHFNQPAVRNYAYTQRYGNVRNQNFAQRFAVRPDFNRRGDDHRGDHHHFRRVGNRFVIIDGGYSYPYYYGDTYPDAYLTPAPDYTVQGDTLISDVQEALAEQGYYHSTIDGAMGTLTRDAIIAYQRDHNLPTTGAISAPMLSSLGLD